MGVRFECPNGHKLHVKAHLAGERGICPDCDSRFIVPAASGGRVAPAEEQLPAEETEEKTEEKVEEKPAEEKPAEAKPEEKPVEALEVGTSLDTSVAPPKPHRSSRQSRRQRARRLTIILAALSFVLAIALIFILW